MSERTRPDPAIDADVAPLEPSPGLRDRVLGALEPARRLAGFVERVAALFDLPPERARQILAELDAVDGPGWADAVEPGVRLHHFRGGGRLEDAHCGLVSMPPGSYIRSHRHRGDEWMLVLSGAVVDDRGRRWLPGDLVHQEDGSAHRLQADGEEPCAFAVAIQGALELLEE